jgi:Flp pilus assembly protein TadG
MAVWSLRVQLLSIVGRSLVLCHPVQSHRFNPFRRLRTDENGFTAVEFAMVIGPFLALLFAIIEVGLTYFVGFSFEHAVDMAAREIRVGAAQNKNVTASSFRDIICTRLPPLVTCSDVIVDVRAFATFGDAAADPPQPTDDSGNVITQAAATFNTGCSGEVVLVSAYYQWKLLASLPNPGKMLGLGGVGFGNMADGSRLISATSAFKNEPFVAPPPC